MAAPKATISPIAGVPASNLCGSSAYVEWSRKTSAIISPPPMYGGICSSRALLPHRKPTPVGPHILCADATKKSHPMAPTSTGMCGTDWHASTRTMAPAAWAARAISATGLMHASTLDTCEHATSLTLPSARMRSSAARSYCSSDVSGTGTTSAPTWAATICHGTRFAWCSMTDTTMRSPRRRLAAPHAAATRLMLSVALRVKTTSSRDGARIRSATRSRVRSYASVARAASVCAPRWTLELRLS
ncbi:unnamed protein product [Chondrus crispus]|uniref:Uncharacterized protein n=1 Tax=Chondrus crispus TaxID=2769 RepID=R7QRH2_CHOCR|nr:unnamed protein product [Chondrus crispus]CDF40081.1 unnamed protein product [Chondrus crispus]|eukprot:XP_005710375.1 unnamed protein product [Chondrus crispus]